MCAVEVVLWMLCCWLGLMVFILEVSVDMLFIFDIGDRNDSLWLAEASNGGGYLLTVC